jgi:hypothetical protein
VYDVQLKLGIVRHFGETAHFIMKHSQRRVLSLLSNSNKSYIREAADHLQMYVGRTERFVILDFQKEPLMKKKALWLVKIGKIQYFDKI